MKVCKRKGYSAARAAAYPTVEEQLDILFHQGYDAWKEVVQAIKDAHPKPNTKED
jgi:hypothetical protein